MSSPLVSVSPAPDASWVWFDVDDVLVHSAPLFQACMDRHYNKHMPWEKWPHNHYHEFYDIDKDDPQQIEVMRRVWREAQVLELAPLFDDVQESLARLHDRGYAIGLLTARAWHPEGLSITEAMAQIHQLPVSQVISMPWTGTKAQVLESTGTNVAGFIDDTPRHVQGCHDKGWYAVLRDRPWNVTEKRLRRVHNLTEFVEGLDRDVQYRHEIADLASEATPINVRPVRAPSA